MTPTTFTVENPTEILLVEQALVFARQLTRVAKDAPNGQVLKLAEGCVLSQGRAFLRQSLEIVLQAQAEDVEKKGRRSAPAPADDGGTTKASPHGKC
jgi:hypothetical protein